MFQGIVFDMDGLMFDTERLALDAWQAVCAPLGYADAAAVALRTVGLDTANTERVFWAAYGTDFPFDHLRDAWGRWMADAIAREGVPLKPGLFALLDYLKAHGIRMTAATSTPQWKAQKYFAQTGVDAYFTDFISGDQIQNGKPAPDIYLAACALLDLPPEGCLALEDSLYGIESAHRAGLKAVMIPDLLQPDAKTKALLYDKVNSLTDVISLLKGWS